MEKLMFKIHALDIDEKNSLDAALEAGDNLWRWAMAECYKNYTKEALAQQLEEFGKRLKRAGKSELMFLKLINDKAEHMPSDARVDFLYRPTYVAAAVFIYAYNRYPDLFEAAQYKGWLQDLLKAALSRRLKGHGYDAELDLLENLLLFAKAGAKDFMGNTPKGCEEFSQLLQDNYQRLAEQYAEAKAQGKPFWVQGFDRVECEEQAKDILELLK